MRTNTFILLAIAAISTTDAWSDSAVYQTVLPSVEPTATRDPWQCVTANLTQYFDVPKPTGSLLDALDSYGDKLIESCTSTGIDRVMGCFPAKEEWCKFTTAAPASVLPDYQLYGSAASAWWSGHSSNAVRLATSCPNGWYNAMFELPGGPTWLNETIIFAACHGEAVTTTTASGSTLSSTATKATATTLPGVTAVPTASVTPAPTNGVAGRGEDLEMWMVAGSGFVAAAANSMWNGL
ncbi:hypothetical protein DL95DRAFT_477388 [Leptodontidium sp. 2 PMI_412]|nr:hypothetical protein BKA61DRAFT_662697 [Leptodontidium sp. MPI-SDFR-AT-0119]KAH9209368.1 hypothetical protein DL95DRAFT_477388 [Leptodontidium sp. 2 PMI_412]